MAMPKDIKVVVLRFLNLTTIHPKVFVFGPLELLLLLIVVNTAFTRPCLRNADPQVRVYPCEHPLTDFAVEESLQDFIRVVTRTESISVTDQKFLVADFDYPGLSIDWYPELLREIVKHPHVVIPCEENHRDARIPDGSELSKKPGKPLRDSVLVLEPEIENVTQQVDRVRIMTHAVKPLDDQVLSTKA